MTGTVLPYDIGVHATHCCTRHGCKYFADEKCPVKKGDVRQMYPCEFCGTKIDRIELAAQEVRDHDLESGFEGYIEKVNALLAALDSEDDPW